MSSGRWPVLLHLILLVFAYEQASAQTRIEAPGGVAAQSITTRRARRADADFYALPAQKRFPIARRFMQNKVFPRASA